MADSRLSVKIEVKKALIATVAVLALASPAAALDGSRCGRHGVHPCSLAFTNPSTSTKTTIEAPATDAPLMSQIVYDADEGHEGNVGACKDHSVNIFAKMRGRISVNDNSVFAIVDRNGHSYTAAIWCENKRGVLIFTAAGPAGVDYAAVNAVIDEIKDGWQHD